MRGKACEHAIGPVVRRPRLRAPSKCGPISIATVGTFSSDARLLYEPMVTLAVPSGTNNTYSAPGTLEGAPRDNLLWIVVHDDQGGADWVTVPLEFGSKAVDGGTTMVEGVEGAAEKAP